jgi:Spy/CpxP family protein refolding chaperone
MTPKKTSKNPIKRWLTGGAAIVAALALGTAAYAGHRGGGFGPGGRGFGVHRIVRSLDLTEAQEVLAVRLMRQLREERRAMRASHLAELQSLKAEVASSQPDAERLHALLDQMAKERTQFAHEAVDKFLELHATLSAEQRAELVGKIEKMEERRRRWHEE